MTNQHCPGFESNKSLNAVKLRCPDCGKEVEVFSDEMDKVVKCPKCGKKVDPKTCAAS
jgi:DNA-directed RNA polymerase subunit RPC12/RpoP